MHEESRPGTTNLDMHELAAERRGQGMDQSDHCRRVETKDAMGDNVNIERALRVQGWMSPAELTFLAETASRVPGKLVEIGSYKGRSACAIAENTGATLYCCDIWSECGTDGWYYDVFCDNTRGLDNIVAVNRASIWAAREFAAKGTRFGLIFIDAAHDRFNVRQDILAWRPLLADGGVFCGHDYNFKDHPEVKPVVDELCGPVDVIDTIWIART
jgi:predicted O-methyltransferase YrrM